MKSIFDVIKEDLELMFRGSTWMQVLHFGFIPPAKTNKKKQEYVGMGKRSRHCGICLNLNGCQFPVDKKPKIPMHFNCHCFTMLIKEPIAHASAFAMCPPKKITNYAFDNDAKKHFFESNGYDIIDSEYMVKEYERQAVEKYVNGDFLLGKLDEYGQRITITIELPRRTGKHSFPLTLKSG